MEAGRRPTRDDLALADDLDEAAPPVRERVLSEIFMARRKAYHDPLTAWH